MLAEEQEDSKVTSDFKGPPPKYLESQLRYVHEAILHVYLKY
jgi:hypothetical protein